MLDTNKYIQYGFPRTTEDIKGITLHETNNYKMNAKELFDYLNKENKTSQGCHYLVDDKEVVEVMPIDWGVWHTGKAYDYGDKYTIAIEICSSISNEKYEQAETNAIQLIKQLMEENAITQDSIFFHKDFNEKTYCPKTMLDKYGSAKRFAIEKL